jgi:hypothetical protein
MLEELCGHEAAPAVAEFPEEQVANIPVFLELKVKTNRHRPAPAFELSALLVPPALGY